MIKVLSDELHENKKPKDPRIFLDICVKENYSISKDEIILSIAHIGVPFIEIEKLSHNKFKVYLLDRETVLTLENEILKNQHLFHYLNTQIV